MARPQWGECQQLNFLSSLIDCAQKVGPKKVGLQIGVHRFNSGTRLHMFSGAKMNSSDSRSGRFTG